MYHAACSCSLLELVPEANLSRFRVYSRAADRGRPSDFKGSLVSSEICLCPLVSGRKGTLVPSGLRGPKGHYAEAPTKVEDTKSTLAGRHQKLCLFLVRVRDLSVWEPVCPLRRGEADGWEVLVSSVVLAANEGARASRERGAVGPA